MCPLDGNVFDSALSGAVEMEELSDGGGANGIDPSA